MVMMPEICLEQANKQEEKKRKKREIRRPYII